jgi:hypothetical protein
LLIHIGLVSSQACNSCPWSGRITHFARPVFALASWTAERRAKGWYIRKTDQGGDWHGPYSTIASVSLMIARELAKELAKRGGFASRD